MRSNWISLSVLSALVMSASIAQAGAPGSATAERYLSLPRVCQGGSNAGNACTDDPQCPGGKCIIEYLIGPGTVFPAWVTLIVDNNVSQFDGTEDISDVIAVTVLLEVKYRGQKYLLAQTYQNLEGADYATLTNALRQGPYIADTGESDRRVTETRLNDAITKNPAITILDDLLWQSGDSEIANELRAILGVSGKPVIAQTPKTIGPVTHSPHGADGLGSVARVKVKVRFVPGS